MNSALLEKIFKSSMLESKMKWNAPNSSVCVRPSFSGDGNTTCTKNRRRDLIESVEATGNEVKRKQKAGRHERNRRMRLA